MHRFLLANGLIHETSEPLVSPGQTGFMNGWGVFSTIRVFNGVLFAFGRHYERMKRDAALLHIPIPVSQSELEVLLRRLVDANKALNATLRVAIVRNRGGAFEGAGIRRDADVIAFTADLTDWGTGIKAYYVRDGRHAASPFAGTKITSWAQNLTWLEEAHERGYDEVILLNERGQVSECTSANIFIIRGREVLTPPVESSGCLPGITRAILLEEVSAPDFKISQQDLTQRDLETADQVFITSTTRNLLPVLAIGEKSLRHNPAAFNTLSGAFNHYQSTYAAAHAQGEVVTR
jgi:branched-chain amino acid aminotransferase